MMGRKSGGEAPRKHKKNKTFDKIIAWIHLWPSLISALILIVVCLTGTIVVYSDEIMELSAGKHRFVEQVGAEKLSPAAIVAKFQAAFPGERNPGYIVSYKDPKRATRLNIFNPKEGLRMAYMDPYTGKILKVDPTIHFFYVTAHLHAELLSGEIGHWIVDIASIIFLIELITGLILWWPAKWNKHNRDASFKIKWKAKFKRLNYDLHNVMGFYALTVCLILTLTGLIIAFKPVQNLTLKTFGTSAAAHEWEHEIEDARTAPGHNAHYATLETRLFEKYPDKKEIQIYTWDMNDSSAYYVMKIAKSIGLKSAENAQRIYVDQRTGRELLPPAYVNRHNKVENAYWNLHMGKWMGQLGKLLTFLGGLIATSLPITGFLIWWGRRRKKKKTSLPSRKIRQENPVLT
ncbi:PepSY-associated TM helix domain-containing protein [Niabella terrae]